MDETRSLIRREQLFASGIYDGARFDCVFGKAPTWASYNGTVDIVDASYRKGILCLFRTLQSDKPDAKITGKGGTPWAKGSAYYIDMNGYMAENAFVISVNDGRIFMKSQP
jgi:hypothetical protein